MDNIEYAGFWIRTAAALIDTVLLLCIIVPLLSLIYGNDYWLRPGFVQGGWDIFLNYLLPVIAVMLFWVYRSATPGKLLTRITIVDAKTGAKPSTGQFIIRYLGYYVSILPFFLGIVWVAFDRRKQGWHDKLASTVVIKTNNKLSIDAGRHG